jgi:hypothetical protein
MPLGEGLRKVSLVVLCGQAGEKGQIYLAKSVFEFAYDGFRGNFCTLCLF